ncbi:energy transducer TonB [Winogradskyella sp. DF17]|uniref:Energy transducer TonB n=1 Tax=Winogradskyella pelagia TaxID=2819984 RepID=A0ABS3T3K1_9FLAO|nr:energy transducer TonB [Winogradskyella sp. DF17]MBO3117312.1 energy transducer TonB [Winogradskyella sp. DF17]
MKYLETKHERNSAKITFLISVIILLLLFVVGPQYFDPPEEYGVVVNFGTSDFGSGNKPLSEPRKAVEEKQIDEIQPSETKPTPSESQSEELLTEDNAEEIAIKRQKEAEAKAKAEAERIEHERKEADEKKRLEEEAKRKNLDNLIGGVKNAEGKTDDGEGSDASGGNKGQLDGNNPYAPSYFGDSGPGKGGVGYGLGGRGRPSRQIFKQDCNEYGLVVVRIEVNRAGKVIKVEPGIKGSTNTHPCLLEPAKKIALSHKWPPDSEAPATQVGFVSINFEVSQ